MKRFKQYLRESVIDIARKTFAKKIFDKADTDQPKLKETVRKHIIKGLDQFEGLGTIKDFQLIGSILTKKYRDDADLDVNVLFDVSGDKQSALEKLRKKMAEINGKPIPGTEHPVNYFAVVDKKTFETAEELADAAFDIKNNKFIKETESKPFNIDKYMDDFHGSVERFDILRGELIRDIIDLKELEKLSSDEVSNLKGRVEKKVKELENDIEALVGIYGDAKQVRRDVFSKPLSPEEIRKYGSKNLLPQNVVYKLLEKYFYFDLVNKLKKIIGDDGKLSDKEAKKLAKLDVTPELKDEKI